MKQFTLLMALLFSTTLSFSQETFPIDFENDPADYNFNNFGGSSSEFVVNPDVTGENTSATVLKLKKGGETWAGTGITRTTLIDFSQNSLVTMKVYTNRIGAKIKFKIENNPDYNNNVQKEVLTTKANEWETLSFDFGGTIKTDLSTIVFFIDDGTPGEDTDDWVYLIDDINISPSSKVLPSLPLTFEVDMDYGIEDFNKNISEIVDNPSKTGKNTSDKVVKVQKRRDWWSGNALVIDGTLDLVSTPIVRMKVYSPRVGAGIKFKIEGSADNKEIDMATTVANEWEIIDFDFTGELANAYNKIVVFFDPGKDGVDNDGETIDHDGVTLGYSDFTFYYDDVELVASGALANNFSSLVDGVKIYAAGKSVKLENLEKVLNGSIDVYNITGQKVANKQISNNSESLELSQSGLYIVLISDKNGSKLKADKLFVN